MWAHTYLLSAVDWHHNLSTESSVANPAEATPTFPLDYHSHPSYYGSPAWITVAQLCGALLWTQTENCSSCKKTPEINVCIYSQHDLSKYCSVITEGWNGTVSWEKEYLMPVLLTNILDCEIMALGSFLSAPSTNLLDFHCLVNLNKHSTNSF